MFILKYIEISWKHRNKEKNIIFSKIMNLFLELLWSPDFASLFFISSSTTTGLLLSAVAQGSKSGESKCMTQLARVSCSGQRYTVMNWMTTTWSWKPTRTSKSTLQKVRAAAASLNRGVQRIRKGEEKLLGWPNCQYLNLWDQSSLLICTLYFHDSQFFVWIN